MDTPDKTRLGVLHYLGHRDQAMDSSLSALLDGCIAACRAAAKPLSTWRIFDVCCDASGALSAGPLALPGADIRRHLGDASHAAVLALTLGAEVDALIRRWELQDMTRAVVLDACATQLAEELADTAESEINEEARRRGLFGNGRYSPGYGDLPLDIQPALLQAVDAGRRIGLTCSESLILLPRKSVTAVVGLSATAATDADGNRCDRCNMADRCPLRKRNTQEGNG